MATRARDPYEVWRAFVDAYKAVHRSADRNLERLGTRVQEIRLLNTLECRGSVPMSLLAEELLTTQASITGLVDDLEEHGLVERERSTEDRRVINVTITKKGKETLHLALQSHKEFVSRILRSITQEKAEELVIIMEGLRAAAIEEEEKIKEARVQTAHQQAGTPRR
jgi:MarR family transcriptional regulator, organic hydroperoxide resistance regulator